jgi:CopG family nickel-responsive transcriptional regulator
MPKKFGVYLSDELLEELEKYQEITGVKSKSRLIQEALRLLIAEHRWQSSGRAVGVIGVIYNHEVGHVDEELTDIQHDYIDIIVSTVHVHLDEEKCMLTIIVRGNTNRIKEMLSRITGIKGVLLARPLLLEAE